MASIDEHAQSGLKAIEERRFDDAIRGFRSAVDLAPDRPDINHALGMAHIHRGDAGNAIPYLLAAVRLSEPYDLPQHQALKRDFQMSLATAHQLLDEVEPAQRVLERVIATWPDAVEAHLQLGQLLLSSCRPVEGCQIYEAASDWLDKEQRESAEALVGSVRAFLDSGHDADVFLEAHADSYRQYFDEVVAGPVAQGWFAEAARMSRGADGTPLPVLTEGARPYAMVRVDLVNPADGTVSSVYSESDPMVVGVEGLEPLAQVPVLLPWNGQPFEVWVSSRCPWHWLGVVVQFRERTSEVDRIACIDDVIGAWYLAGYNGEFGDEGSGRFHYVTDPEPIGTRSVAYIVDLGRSRLDAIRDLLRRLAELHARHPLRRVLFGEGRLPEDEETA